MPTFTNEEEISLSNLADGAAIELFDLELRRVLDNIGDPNHELKFKREITLTVTFEPTDTVGVLAIKITPKTKLASRQTVITTAMYGKDPLTGKMEVRELAGQQRSLPGFEDQKPRMEKKYNA